jgi:hypothetical protein
MRALHITEILLWTDKARGLQCTKSTENHRLPSAAPSCSRRCCRCCRPGPSAEGRGTRGRRGTRSAPQGPWLLLLLLYRVGPLSGNSLADFRRIPSGAPSKSFGGFLPSSSEYIDVRYIIIRSRKSFVLLLAMYFFLIAKRVKKIQMYLIYSIIIASIKIREIYLRQCPSSIPHKEKVIFLFLSYSIINFKAQYNKDLKYFRMFTIWVW